jgi:hypothetical protein
MAKVIIRMANLGMQLQHIGFIVFIFILDRLFVGSIGCHSPRCILWPFWKIELMPGQTGRFIV